MDSSAILNDAVLSTTIEALEIQRIEVKKLKIRGYSLFFGGLLLAVVDLLGLGGTGFGLIPGLILLIFGGIFLYQQSNKFDAYRDAFKTGIVGSILKKIDPSFELAHNAGLSESAFNHSQLFTQGTDRYTSQDQIMGKAGKTIFSFSEVHAEYKTETQTKNGRQTHWHTIFKGIIFCADFNKHFHGVTVVRPKDFGNKVGAWFSKNMSIFSSSDKEIVNLESPDFEKNFITYSTDQVEARYILTPSMMERICSLNNRGSDTVSLSFINSEVYIAFPLTKDYFEPPVFTSLQDMTSINEDMNVINFMLEIITELDLNTRIWTKQ